MPSTVTDWFNEWQCDTDLSKDIGYLVTQDDAQLLTIRAWNAMDSKWWWDKKQWLSSLAR